MVGKIRHTDSLRIKDQTPGDSRLVSPGTFDRVQKLLDIRSSHKKQHHVNDYPLVKILWSQEGDCGFHGETQPKKKASYYRTKAKVAGRKIYLGQKGVESEFSRLLVRIQIRPEMAEGCRAEMLARLKERVPGQRQLEADKLGKQVQRLEEKARTLIRLHTNGDISYDEFRGERSLNEAAQRELRERLSHVSAGFEKEAHESPPGWRFCRASRSSGTGARRRNGGENSQNSCSPA